MTTTKDLPEEPIDVAASVVTAVARLCVGELTAEEYREERQRVNSMRGVDIRSLPRDAEFGFSLESEVPP